MSSSKTASKTKPSKSSPARPISSLSALSAPTVWSSVSASSMMDSTLEAMAALSSANSASSSASPSASVWVGVGFAMASFSIALAASETASAQTAGLAVSSSSSSSSSSPSPRDFLAFAARRSSFDFLPSFLAGPLSLASTPFSSGGFLRMKVQSLWDASASERSPQALQSKMMSAFLSTCIEVSGRRHLGQITNCLTNLCTSSCSTFVSCAPLTVPEPTVGSYFETAPSSTAQYLVRYSGGRLSERDTSLTFTNTVLIPLPRPSILPTARGILYRYEGSSPPPMLRLAILPAAGGLCSRRQLGERVSCCGPYSEGRSAHARRSAGGDDATAA
mmetsp:Transcript_4056/g.10336  ORF Transcript_4056/g.10336 Transcript_4056/m.10336 type:complete len:333 (+) Transcript_4056:578-1576(+)